MECLEKDPKRLENTDHLFFYGKREKNDKTGIGGFEKVTKFAKEHFAEIVCIAFAALSLYMAPIAFFVSLPCGVVAGAAYVTQQAEKKAREANKEKEFEEEDEDFESDDNNKINRESNLITEKKMDIAQTFVQAFTSGGTYFLASSYILSSASGYFSGINFGCFAYRKIKQCMDSLQ